MAVEDRIKNMQAKLPSAIMLLMKNLNFLIMLLIAFIMCMSTYGIVEENGARAFLLKVPHIPMVPWLRPILVLVGMLVLLVIMSVRKDKEWIAALLTAAELALALFMIYITGFEYTGLILLIFADYIRYTGRTKYTYTVLAAAFAIYIFLDYDLVAKPLSIVPFSVYISYYNNLTRGVLIGINSICSGLNSLLFIIYMIFIMHNQSQENKQMQELNSRLNAVNEELKQANIQLEENARTIASMTKTEERNRLAREIHDTLGHVLTGVITGIDACIELISIAPDATKKQLEVIANVARQGMTDVRRSVRALRPDALEKLAVGAAINKMIEEMRLSTGVEINYTNIVELSNLSEDEENIVYRIIQESITNSIRHGKASKIDISIEQADSLITIRVIDNGIGCKDITSGFGLRHMEERLSMLGGSLSYDGSKGFKVVARLPKRLN